MIKRCLAAAGALLALTHAAHADNVTDWRWLSGTTWIVPSTGLLAYVYTPSENVITPVQDQTVYTITGYRNGYFWGRTATRLSTSSSTTCKSLVGSVTPEGKIYLTFTTYPFNGSDPTVGIGNMQRKFGQWTMANQMSTGAAALQVGHWAYMVQSSPGTPSWASLPGVNTSVPNFMSPCLDAAPKVPPP